MPFRDPVDGLRDIRDAIDMIERFTEGMDFAAFREDPKSVAAVERKLLVISEAASRLGEQGPALCPDRNWHKIRGTGNWIRHQYERINLQYIWHTMNLAIVLRPPV